jgi:hypothetical protein
MIMMMMLRRQKEEREGGWGERGDRAKGGED